MHPLKILHQSILGGCYVGFGGLLALSVAGNMAGTMFSNPGIVKMTFAALFPVNLLLIVMTGGQLFTGNSGTCAAAKLEGMIDSKEMWTNLAISLTGNVIGCGLFAYVAMYCGLLSGGTAALAKSTAVSKCAGAFMPSKCKHTQHTHTHSTRVTMLLSDASLIFFFHFLLIKT
jgi:formate/nitrite transporter FocA (FNT family)